MPHLINHREISADYNTVYFHEDDEVRTAKLEMWIAKALGEDLMDKYPRRQWGIEVNIPGRMIIITCPNVSMLKGYHLAMKDDNIKALMVRAREAAGEIMERYGLSTGRDFNPDHAEAMSRGGVSGDEVITPNVSDAEGIDPIKRSVVKYGK